MGRNTQGVTLMRVSKDERLQGIERVDGSIVEPEDDVEMLPPGDAPATDAPSAPH